MHLVCSSQEIVLQRHRLPLVLCNASLKPSSFHHSWTLRWRKDLCRMHSYSLPPGANVQGWIRWEGEYLDGGSLTETFMLDHWRGQNMIPKETSRGMVILSALLTVELIDLPLPFLYPAMKESYPNPDVSSAETLHLFIKPLAWFMCCTSRAMMRSPCGHGGEKLNEAKGPQNFRTWKWMKYLMPVWVFGYKNCCCGRALLPSWSTSSWSAVLYLLCSLFLLLANLLKEKPVTSL